MTSTGESFLTCTNYVDPNAVIGNMNFRQFYDCLSGMLPAIIQNSLGCAPLNTKMQEANVSPHEGDTNNHDFRASYATGLKENSMEISSAAEIMVHKDTCMMARVYAPTRHEIIISHQNLINTLLENQLVVPAVTAAIKSLCFYTQRKTANPVFARLAV